MKKLFMVFAVAAIFTACDNSTKTESTTTDSTTVATDTSMMSTPAPADTGNMMSADTSKMTMSADTTKK